MLAYLPSYILVHHITHCSYSPDPLFNIVHKIYSISAKHIAAAVNNVELTPAMMDIETSIQATGDVEPIMVVVTPKRDFSKAKVVCM